jgi:lipid-binding SYLF domain-containing protein
LPIALILPKQHFKMRLFKTSGLDKECDKAAQILKSFTGKCCFPLRQLLLLLFIREAYKPLDKDKIPSQAITEAKGVAVFTGFRAGMYLAGAGGSGVVVARLPDGSWSPPSAFSVRSGGFGIVYGVDVYDCVCVLNSQAAVDAYTKTEVTLGSGVALTVGPMSVTPKTRGMAPVWVYTKSRGLYGGASVDGTVISQRSELNADFYGVEITSEQILKGEVAIQDGATKWPAGALQLTEILKLIEGKSADSTVLQKISREPTPGDMQE